MRRAPRPLTLASMTGFSSPLADAIETTGAEPSSTITRQAPALGLETANWSRFARGSLSMKNGACWTGRSPSGDVSRSPFGPASVTFGIPPWPRTTNVAPGSPGGRTICSS